MNAVLFPAHAAVEFPTHKGGPAADDPFVVTLDGRIVEVLVMEGEAGNLRPVAYEITDSPRLNRSGGKYRTP